MIVGSAKRLYAASLLAEAKSTQQKWKVLNKLACPYAQKQTIESIQIDNNSITDPMEITSTFNEYFTNIGPNLACSIQVERYSLEPVRYAFKMPSTDWDEVNKIINQLRNAAPGHNQVQASVLKAAVNSISIPLADLIHTSFQQGKVPAALKKAVVTLIHKAKSREDQ